MRFEFFIAKRIYKAKSGNNTFSRPAIVVAIAGISVGIIVMILSVSVVLGFKREVSEKVVGFKSHIQILNLHQGIEAEMDPVLVDDSLIKILNEASHIVKYQVFANKTGLIKTNDDFKGVVIKGVGEGYCMDFFQKYLVQGSIPCFSSEKSSQEILLSLTNANELKLKVHDKVLVYFFDSSNSNIRARKLEVAGIFDTHLDEFDSQVCITDIYTVRKLNSWNTKESTGVEIILDDVYNVSKTMNYLIESVNHGDLLNNYSAYSMYELSPAIFSWLDILDMNVVMILVLMMVIGGFTVMAGLLIVMLERIQMIGLLKALGCNNNTIRGIFSGFAVMLVGKGIIVGDIIALLFCTIQKLFSVVKLDPSTYYIDAVPIEINWLYVLLINVGVAVISSIIIFGSSFMMSIKGPSTTMKWD